MNQRAAAPLMALSFSRLTTFEQCEAKFEHLYVRKTVKDTDNEFTLYGTRVHEGLEKYGRALVGTVADEAIVALEEDEFPADVRPWLRLVKIITQRPGEKHFEKQVAIRRDFTPCDWFAPDVWIRGVLDVLVLDGTRAFVVDWKTGKVKENPTQLQLFAALVFAHFPEVEEVKTMFVWLAHDQTSDAVYQRKRLHHIWNALSPRFARVQEAVELGIFKAHPSGLCRWCPARGVCAEAR